MSTGKFTDGMVVPLRDFELEDLPAGRVCEQWLGLSVGLASMLVLPALVVRGLGPGPVSLIVAGVHGDEFEGMAAVPGFVRSLDPGALAGTVVGLPVCNPLAFEAQSRESPPPTDGKNLARVFPGRSTGSATERLAAELFGFVRRLLGPEDLFIDLHSGGTRYRYLDMVGYRDVDSPSRETSEESARHFGGGRLWSMDDERGTFNSETSRLGIPTVGTETTGQGGCRREDVAGYTTGLRNLLRHRGMIPGRPPARDDGPAWRPTPIDASTNGLFSTRVDLGEQVVSGDVLGEVLSPFGETLEGLRAPHDGEVWALRAFGSVRAGDMAAWVARPPS